MDSGGEAAKQGKPLCSFSAMLLWVSIFVAVQKRGTIALPPGVRKRFGLDRPGAQVELVERDGEIVLRPHVPVPAEEAWFWSEDWQASEKAVDDHVQAGDTTKFESATAFDAHLAELSERE